MAQKQISGEDAFRLYDTFGFPLDLTQLLAAERGLGVDVDGFNREMEKQRERARAAHQSTVITVADDSEVGQATRFVGYEASNLVDFETFVVDVAQADGGAFLVFERSPFYAEMGGQLGDMGSVRIDGQAFAVSGTVRDAAGRHLHALADVPAGVDLAAFKGRKALVTVDATRRSAIQRHHTATHILHWALRKTLGTHVRQAGSLVAPDRLRFDFAHFEAIAPEALKRIEDMCNERILANEPVRWREFDFADKPSNAMAFFGEKYGNRVRVVAIGRDVGEEPASYESGWSVELCGGTHVCATGEIGLLKVIAETGISAGTRRIEAVCGQAALELFQERYGQVQALADRMSCKPAEIEARLDAQQAHLRELEKQLKALQAKASAGQAGELAARAVDRGGIKVVAAVAEAPDPNALRQVGVNVQRALGESVIVLAMVQGGKGTLLALCSEGAIQAGHKAGDIVRTLTAKLGGKGGGKPDFAMGGFSDAGGAPAVLDAFLR